jgi:hypothetical protein
MGEYNPHYSNSTGGGDTSQYIVVIRKEEKPLQIEQFLSVSRLGLG